MKEKIGYGSLIENSFDLIEGMVSPSKDVLIRHLVLYCGGIKGDYLEDEDLIIEFLVRSSRECGLHALSFNIQRFQPIGLSAYAILEESHISLHTWPEFHFCFVDIVTCGTTSNPFAVKKLLTNMFHPKAIKEKVFTVLRK